MQDAIPGKYRATVLYYRAVKQPPPPIDWQVTVRLRDGRTRETFTGRLTYDGGEKGEEQMFPLSRFHKLSKPRGELCWAETLDIGGGSAIAVVVIIAFAIERTVTAVLFLLPFNHTWAAIFRTRLSVQDSAKRIQAESAKDLFTIPWRVSSV